jgi:hypothetical protein
VTLAFDGHVVSIQVVGTPTFEVPDNIVPGTEAALTLTFEAIPFPEAAEVVGPFTSPGGHANISPTNMLLRLGSTLLADDLATLYVEHDPLSPGTPETPGSVLQRELIDVKGAGFVAIASGVEWVTSGGFANLGSVLDGGEQLYNPAVWNLLPLRSLTTTFAIPGNSASIVVTSEFGDGVAVPEPSIAICVYVAIYTIATLSRSCRR